MKTFLILATLFVSLFSFAKETKQMNGSKVSGPNWVSSNTQKNTMSQEATIKQSNPLEWKRILVVVFASLIVWSPLILMCIYLLPKDRSMRC